MSKRKKDKGIELNSNIVAGILSILVLITIAAGAIYLIVSGIFPFGIMDIVMIVVFSYTSYKTLFKKEKLTKWEWVAFVILFFIALAFFLIGFVIGIMKLVAAGTIQISQ